MTQAQVKIINTGDVFLGLNVKCSSTTGNMFFPASQDIRFGGDMTGAGPKWNIGYTGSGTNFGLNFGKLYGTNIGDYKLFIHDNGNVGIGAGNILSEFIKLTVTNNVTSTNWNYGIVANAVPSSSGISNNIIGIRATAYNSTSLSSGNGIGVWGVAGNIGGGVNYGVWGQLLGTNNGVGVYGSISTDLNAMSGRYAGFFNGTTKILGQLYVNDIQITSDKRAKKEITYFDSKTDNIAKLSSIKGIRFKYKNNAELRKLLNPNAKDSANTDSALNAFYNKTQIGIIAQDVQLSYPELVQTDQDGLLSVNYIGFIPILIESVKDLQKQVDNKDTKLANQQTDIDDLKQQITDLRAIIAGCCSTKTKLKSNSETDISNNLNTTITTTLYQNAPNPFKENTSIRIDLPQNVSKALLNIYDLTGKQLKTFSISERGTVTITINGKDLAAGMYHYALITDGNLIDTKMMILTE